MAISARAAPLRPPLAVLLYVTFVLALLTVAWSAVAGLGEQRATVQAAETMLEQLEGRPDPTGHQSRPGFAAAPAGSPFVDGQTVTVAGAALLQRIAEAVSKVGGTVQSSQVELEQVAAKDGWIGVVVSCELRDSAVQALLYDLESGMPFLFVEQVVLQAPVMGVEESRMRVLLTVAGKWGGGK
ncbi:MAG: type II secretion system protein GspM [Xanthobacteraceae bacterium]